MATRIQLRRDTSTNWTTADPVLSQWEIWLETDSLKIKIWDGESLRSELNYFAGAWWATTFLELTDAPDNYTDQEWKVVKVNATADWLEFGEASTSDEKVKYDAWDTTAGYVADKIVAWTWISVAEWTGADENKLVVTSTITQATRESLWLDTDDTVTFAAIKLTTGAGSWKVLTSDADWDATWETATGWMENPMTTAWDIIYGGDSGTPTRLAKGDDGEVLKLVSGVPSWEADAGWMTDPMTTRWDIIFRDASWPARLAKWASGTVLTMGANDPAWATPFSQTTQTLTDWATVSWNASSWSCWILTLGWNRELSNMTNAIAWRTYTLIVKQDWTGSRTLSYGNQYFTPGDTTPVLSSTANAVDILQFLAESSTVFHLINFISDSK